MSDKVSSTWYNEGMTVAELITELQKIPGHREVHLWDGEYMDSNSRLRSIEYRKQSARGYPVGVYLGWSKR